MKWAPILVLAMVAGCTSPLGNTTSDAPLAEMRTSFFHSAMSLVAAPEPNQSVVRAGAFYQAWAAGIDYPTWVADPFGADVRVTAAKVTLFLQVTGLVLENENFPDIMVYGGSGEAWMGFGSRSDYVAFQPGQVYTVEVELEMPRGGLWLPPGEGFGLKVVPVMFQQDDEADVEILVGGNDTGSRVVWTTESIELPRARAVRGEATGEVTGTIYAGPAAPATTSERTPLPLDANVVWVVAWMNTTDNVGIPDIDLSIVRPDGAVIAMSGTPTPREAIRVNRENLGGAGDFGLVVTTAGSPRASYKLEWYVGTATT